MHTDLSVLLSKYSGFYPILGERRQADPFVKMDFTNSNTALQQINLNDIEEFSNYVFRKIELNGAKFGIGGYAENRVLYQRFDHFTAEKEPRSIHLGVDIWDRAGTEIFAPLAGKIHSFANNNNLGDYGPTIILEHHLHHQKFYTLYGHLSMQSIENKAIGQQITKGERFCDLGNYPINGNWPPHLHFQVIGDMQGKIGDYPGVCKPSEMDVFLNNCPDPMLILKV